MAENSNVQAFQEKPEGDGGWINGGFFVCQPEFFNYLGDDDTILEKSPLEKLVQDEQLVAFRHSGFWQPMDTMREKSNLEKLWDSNEAPWKVW